MKLADVAILRPMRTLYTYEVSERTPKASRGKRVLCPFGKRMELGVVMQVREGDPPPKIKALQEVLDETPTLSEELLSFLEKLAGYYLAPIGEVLALALPPTEREVKKKLALARDQAPLFGPVGGVGARKVLWIEWVGDLTLAFSNRSTPKKRLVVEAIAREKEIEVARLEERFQGARVIAKQLEKAGFVRIFEKEKAEEARVIDERDTPPKLTDRQEAAVAEVASLLGSTDPRPLLVWGVTGSGKTEVYLHAVSLALAKNRSAIVLVPEIALTPQLVDRFRRRFGDAIGVIHSALTPSERFGMWQGVRKGTYRVVVGARSALFAPVSDLGLIVVDEEHDGSFKQEEGVRYHARDMALLRAHRAGALCVLGSATPSLETLQLVRTERAHLIELRERATKHPVPHVEVIDLRRYPAGPTGDRRISLPLHRAIEETLRQKEQAILFLNRRGFAPSVICGSCGEIAECPSCSVALTFHKRRQGSLRCHTCDYEIRFTKTCSKCKVDALELEGLGTEKIEELLHTAFPEARIARLDRDVATGKNIESILSKVRSGEIDLLVGTQMVTKGHDLPNVTLVGVLNADAALSIPDFRAAERAFQLLVQVAGRAGRGDKPGRVLLQTFNPEHPAIVFAVKHDVRGFLETERTFRRELHYPPFSRLALIRIDDADEEKVHAASQSVASMLRAFGQEKVAPAKPEVQTLHILGPAEAPIYKVRNRYRMRVLLRAPDRAILWEAAAKIETLRKSFPHSLRLVFDMDPMQML